MRTFALTAVFIPILFLQPSLADDAGLLSEARKCSSLEAAGARMTCYDHVFKGDGTALLPVDSSEEKAEVTTTPTPDGDANLGQQWRFGEKKRELDGRTDVYLSVRSDNTQSNQIGSPEYSIMWLRCEDGVTAMYTGSSNYIADDPTVRYRLDSGKVQKSRMGVSADGEGFGLWSGSAAIPFIKSLFGKSKLVISYDSYSRQNIEFSFDVSGLKNRIEPLATACKWKP